MEMTPRLKRGLIAFLLFDAAIVLALVFLFVLRGERELLSELREIGVTVYPEARPVEPFTLVDENLNSFTQSDLNGKWSMLFFGFTSCPDICPLTMVELKKFYEQLEDPKAANDLAVAMVSVDPLRDSPEIMGEYVEQFNADFLGVSGPASEIEKIAGQFFIAYTDPMGAGSTDSDGGHHEAMSHSDSDNSSAVEPNSYLIEHSGHIALINPAGEFHAVLRPPHRAQDLLKAYSSIKDLSGF